MGTKITVSLRSLMVTAGVVLAVVAAYMMGGGGVTTAVATGESSTGAATSGTTTDTRTLVMTGTGEVTGVPDQLTFRFAVHEKSYDVTSALHAANATMRRVLAALAHQGVAKKDVQTTGMSIQPEYAYSSGQPPVLTGYAVTESAGVLVRDLGASGKALNAAATAGGNAVRLYGLGLKIGNRDALMSRARDAAVSEAQMKARQYAKATGQTLGPVASLKEVRATPAPVYGVHAAAVDVAGARPVPIRAGSKELKVTVSIAWQLR
jgi:uncharacterized protein YggE